MSGALTSTPGLAAAIEASGISMASVGYGIAYPFGVVGVVLFVLNTLGSICGGKTSTPALGTLLSTTKSDTVSASYAATCPVALIAVVLACQFVAKFL